MLGKQMLVSCLKRKQTFLVKGQQEFLTAEPSLQPLIPLVDLALGGRREELGDLKPSF